MSEYPPLMEYWAHPEREYKQNWLAMVYALMRATRIWKTANGALAVEAHRKMCLAAVGLRLLENFYEDTLGLSRTWALSSRVENVLERARDLAAMSEASGWEKKTIAWGEEVATVLSGFEAVVKEFDFNDGNIELVDDADAWR